MHRLLSALLISAAHHVAAVPYQNAEQLPFQLPDTAIQPYQSLSPPLDSPLTPLLSHDDDRLVYADASDSSFDAHVQMKGFPGHQVRVKSPQLGCDSVPQYSGYLDTPQDKHFYFWVFESRNDPVNDPVTLWLNGGPGCSSFAALTFELGPCYVDREDASDPVHLHKNKFAWNRNSTVIFLDQPVGVGFSYADKGVEAIGSTEEAAVDVHAFLSIWFSAFHARFGENDFHMAGESYFGRYGPVFADYITDKNQELAPSEQINLKSVLVGNGFTHPTIQYASYFPTVCSHAGGYGPYLSEGECHAMLTAIPECQRLTAACEANVTDTETCKTAMSYCEETQTQAYYNTGRNPYDMSRFDDYSEEEWMEEYLNRPDVRHELGVDREEHGGVRRFVGCSDKVGKHFDNTGDGAKPSYYHVSNLLKKGIRMLFYAGDRDFICNWLGNEQWLLQLEWEGQPDFKKQTLAPWHVPEESGRAGMFRSHDILTFATVARSGHFVPYDRPRQALGMFNAWVHGGAGAFRDLLS